jgi:hypothetical protein
MWIFDFITNTPFTPVPLLFKAFTFKISLSLKTRFRRVLNYGGSVGLRKKAKELPKINTTRELLILRLNKSTEKIE